MYNKNEKIYTGCFCSYCLPVLTFFFQSNRGVMHRAFKYPWWQGHKQQAILGERGKNKTKKDLLVKQKGHVSAGAAVLLAPK